MRRSLRFLRYFLRLVAVGLVYLTSETFVNPETGRKAHVGLSDTQEQQLGLQSFVRLSAIPASSNPAPLMTLSGA
jgi:hypothetical protein